MPSTVLVGAQWGDEGKGKITDLIASDYDYVVRFQGGNNAGHTVIHGDKKLALHLMPSGVMYENAVPVIGNGVVVDPGVLVKEMAMLEAEGISCKNLKISNDAHLIMPYHKDLDGADEKSLGDKKIGTTKRGIGPCYQDKMGRKGIRMQDLLDEKIFRLKLEAVLAQKNPILEKIYGLHTYTVEEICDEYLPYARILAPYVCESAHMLNEALADGKSILFEGAQGTLLDIDHGTYPFVTSSSCCAGGASTGTGVGPKAIDRVLGIQKAYVTRVGEGPFPTELKFPENGGTGQDAEDGELLCAAGHEFGVTTGRKRRCGWVRCRHRALRRRGERAYGRGPHEAGRAFGLRHHQGVRGLRMRRRALRLLPHAAIGAAPREAHLRGAARLERRGHHRLPHLRGAAGEHAQVHRVFGRGVRRAHEHHLGWPRPRPDDYPHVLVERRVVSFVRLGRRTIKPTLRFRLAPALAIQRFPSRPEGRSAALQGNCRHQSEPR